MKKQILTTLLVATLALGAASAAPVVHAAGNGTITVKSTQKGATYKAYKIFDATVEDANVNNGAVSYTFPAGVTYNDATFTSLFDTVTNGGKTYVTKKATASDVDIANWAKTVSAGKNAVVTEVESDDDGLITLPVNDYGYYFVDTTAGNHGTAMVTSVSPNAIIQEKNNQPTWGDDGGKTVDDANQTYAVGETIKYTLQYNNATFYNKGEKVYQYVVNDNMPDQAVKLDTASIKVYVDGKLLTAGNGDAKDTYKLELNGNDFKVTIPWAASNTANADAKLGGDDDFYYKPISKIKVEYSGTLLSTADEGSKESDTNKNKATINPNTSTDDPGKSITVHDGEIKINKFAEGQEAKKLQGAKFVLKKGNDFLKIEEPSKNITWVTDQAQATSFGTDAQGNVAISGLDEGTYALVETEAPAGYNVLKDPVNVTLEKGVDGDKDKLIVTADIANKQGAELPSTGGMGTTIFYTLGAILVVGASVILIARRRANQ